MGIITGRSRTRYLFRASGILMYDNGELIMYADYLPAGLRTSCLEGPVNIWT